ncbi:MAG: hypothetical protein WD648_08445, partial [Planctomycetaceae bacterium]
NIASLWTGKSEKPSAQELLQTVVATFAVVDPQTRQFVESCSLDQPSLVPPDGTFLLDDAAHPHFAANMRLFYARYLAQRKMYDEALRVFEKVDPAYVVDPASCLYFKSVCQHQLLMKTEGLATIELLLKNTADVPVRYSSVATLMQYDLEALKEKSLDEISRKMRDSERRLELARSGPKAQKVQSEIIAGLDEIIEELEQQAGGGGGGEGSGGNQNQSSNPANDSVIKGAEGKGDFDKKKFSNQGGWGDLDSKEQAKAKNDINQKFPAHYQKQNEEYFKKLAKRRAK